MPVSCAPPQFQPQVVLVTSALAVPVNVTSTPALSFVDNPAGYMKGFKNPSTQPSVGGQAICISGIVDVAAPCKNGHIDYQEPANPIAVAKLIVEDVQINSTLSERVISGEATVSGTSGIY